MKRKRASHGPAAGLPVQETILVVEDNPITLKLVQVTLQKEGYVVLPAPDGKTALALASREMPDLILQDLKLPDISGVDLVRKLRALPGGDGVPILAFTGFVTRVEEGIIANAGFTDFLIKPLEPSQLVASVQTHLLSSGLYSENPGQGRCLLLVDDDPILRKYTCLQFSNAGFDVIEAASGQQALDQARRQKPDVVLSDVLMPGMDGFQLCHALRQDKLLQRVPVVLVSANYVEEADRRLAASIGASAYVYRSLGITEILNAVISSLTQQVPAPTLRDPEDFERERLARISSQLDRLVNLRVSALQRSYTQAAILNELSLISEALTQRRDVESALEAILAHCLDGVGLSKGLLYLVNDQGKLELRAQYGCSALFSAARDLFGQSELFHQIQRAEYPVQLPSPALPEAAVSALLVQTESESALMIPIQGKADSKGILALFSSSLNLVQEDWVAFGRSLAAQFAQTMALSQTILKLASSEQRYRLIAEATQVVPWEADATTWQFTYIAPQVETMLGYPVPDWHKPGFWADHVHPEDRDRAVNFCRAQVEARKDHVIEYRMVAADGRIIWIRDLVSVELQGGDVTNLRGVFVDITASKQVEQELRHYAEIAVTTTDLFALRSADNRYLVVNDQYCRYLGRTREQIIGRTPAELFPVDQFRNVIEPYSRRCLEGETVQAEAWFDCPGVGRRCIDFKYHPFRDAAGHITGLVVSGRDVTERRQAEDQIIQTKARYHFLLDSSPGVIYSSTLGRECRCTFVNETLLRVTGYEPQAMLDDPDFWCEHLHPDDRERTIAEAEHGIAAGVGTVEYRFRAHNGEYRWIQDNFRVLSDADGRVTELVGSWIDVTAARRTEAHLVQAQKMEAVGQLTGGIAHDFNNRLTVVLGNLELLQRSLGGRPQELRLVDGAIKAAEGGAQLTRQLLTFARQQMTELEILDLNEIVRGLMALLSRTLGEQVKIELALGPGLWRVRTDRSLLENALLNLAVNARDAMPQGGSLTVESGNVVLDDAYVRNRSYAKRGDHVFIAVSDTGTGMSEEIRRRVFEPFFTTKETGRGTGLGLSMVYGFIKQAGGHVEIYSEPGHGSIFTLYFPRTMQEQSAMVTAATVHPPRPARGRRILVAEDNDEVRALAISSLTALGYAVTAAESGPATLAAAEKLDGIDLLFTDMIMPGGMTGVDLAGRLRERWPDLPVLFTSGYAGAAARTHGVPQGMKDFWLSKPYRQFELEAILESIFGSAPANP